MADIASASASTAPLPTVPTVADTTEDKIEHSTAMASPDPAAASASEPHLEPSPVANDEVVISEPSAAASKSQPVEAITEASSSSRPVPLTRAQTEALGPATEDGANPSIIPSTSAVLSLTLQLTNGARHPYKIDERYLTNRNVEARNTAGEFDPRELSGYKLKELIWTDWRSEWEPRPTSPSSIRLIYMGKMLADKQPLKDHNLALNTSSIVHMTIKPAEFDEDEAAVKAPKTGSIRARDPEERDAGCRCVIL